MARHPLRKELTDFTLVFVSIPRNILWRKFENSTIDCRLLMLIMNLYEGSYEGSLYPQGHLKCGFFPQIQDEAGLYIKPLSL